MKKQQFMLQVQFKYDARDVTLLVQTKRKPRRDHLCKMVPYAKYTCCITTYNLGHQKHIFWFCSLVFPDPSFVLFFFLSLCHLYYFKHQKGKITAGGFHIGRERLQTSNIPLQLLFCQPRFQKSWEQVTQSRGRCCLLWPGFSLFPGFPAGSAGACHACWPDSILTKLGENKKLKSCCATVTLGETLMTILFLGYSWEMIPSHQNWFQQLTGLHCGHL
jgi:hypothetical protein